MIDTYFRSRLAKKGVLVGTQCFTGNAAIVEILGHSGWDWVSLDMEHATSSFADIEQLVRAANWSNIVALVRVAENDPVLISKALDSGAAGVIVPHIASAADLREAVGATQYPPHGVRGACSTTRATGYGAQPWKEYVEQANKGVVVIPLIEDKAGVDAFDELLAVDNVPVYWIGITDLTVSLGFPGADFHHPELVKLAKSLNQRAAAAGKELMIAAAPHLRADYIKHLVSLGFRLISIGTDLSLYRQSVIKIAAEVRT